ncbi:uncharacterized protein N0V89_003572 [Didymosphaeria variabile]|uniref:DUF1682-domain-containing protein n=1 Tax=Didymosphaeria variabile TaxID=1932322 RepID=A0A9W9CBM4_9PLEO|nr:uncharacterized protein N0V89_003572 [Didymosphaeria variabile]KAJ4355554.1 hypothetical protein N0V89_003572 [Didymosphaeria variabile]
MADFVKGLFGGQQKVAQPHSGGDDDFADYAGAPDPSPALSSFATTGAASAAPTSTVGQVPYTAWYRVWERTSIDDFKLELYVLPFILVVVAVHLWGTRRNRNKANHWIKSHAPVLQQEFAQVGYVRPQAGVDDVSATGLAQATEKAKQDAINPANFLREKKPDEFASYATGRANVAFVDFKLTLVKRFNPLMRFGELIISLFFESMPVLVERMEATAYVFDGQEAKIAPAIARGAGEKVSNSTFDGFVFAVVHKDLMKRLREDRYDLSLTASKDHAKLPLWVTVMSESAEVTDTVLTPELIKAINDAGDDFEALVITDQPMDQPRKLDDTVPRKRINLSMKLKSAGTPYDSTLPLFTYFLRLPDFLVSKAHFRPEALRRIKATREEQISKIRKLDDDEKAEERKLASDKLKKEQRDAKLGRMTADEQRKYLDKERERDAKKRTKKQTVKG